MAVENLELQEQQSDRRELEETLDKLEKHKDKLAEQIKATRQLCYEESQQVTAASAHVTLICDAPLMSVILPLSHDTGGSVHSYSIYFYIEVFKIRFRKTVKEVISKNSFFLFNLFNLQTSFQLS